MIPNLQRLVAHYDRALEKSPYFCDRLFDPISITESTASLKQWKHILKGQLQDSAVESEAVLSYKFYRALDALNMSDTPAAVERLYDCIVVTLRIIDVLEGRQKLGKPEEEGGAK